MIAQTLALNSKSDVTADQLITLHKDGMGWGQIAAGLGLRLGEVVSAVNAESHVASGQAKADGKVAVVHGEGAKAGLGAGAGVHAGGQGVKAGASLGVETGVKVKP